MSQERVRSPIVVVLGHVDHGKCLHPDERVVLGNGAAVRISSLFKEFGDVQSDEDGYEWIDEEIPVLTIDEEGRIVKGKATKVWRIRHRGPLYTVRLKDGGVIRVTPEHPFLTIEGWVKAENLTPGSLVAVPSTLPIGVKFSEFLHILDRDYLILRVGEATSLRDRRFWRAFFYMLGRAVAFKGLGMKPPATGVDALDLNAEESSILLKVGAERLSRLYKDFMISGIEGAIPGRRRQDSLVPEAVMVAPQDLIKYFLEGYSVEAAVENSSIPEITLLSNSREGAEELRTLLRRLGIVSVVENVPLGWGATVRGVKEVRKLSRRLGREYLLSKDVDLSEDPEQVYHMKIGNLLLTEVEEVSKTQYRGYLYDLSVPPTHAFIANGIVVHNTTLLDKIRGTAVVRKEPGEMTQHVGASMIPASVIEKIIQPLKQLFPIKLTIPGLLFIDTPGHEAFSNLRRRGGSIADFAILVIDVMEGIEKQTIESINILLSRKVPFVIAANKIDRIYGWKPQPDTPFLESIKRQEPRVVEELERRVYTIAGQLAGLNIPAERFDRIRDFRKAIAIVPVSAKTGEGIAELLAVLAGLTQKYLTKRILFTAGPAKGVVLEVKEITGLGTCIDTVIYDGILRKGNTIVVGGVKEPIVTKVRALLMPKPLEEMRVVGESAFKNVDEVVAAAGVRISAPGLDDALAGAPLYAVEDKASVEEVVKKVSEEVTQVRFSKDITGVVVKADTLGTLEALVSMLESRGVPVRLADVGPLTKREVLEASIVAKQNRYLGVILLFNVKPLPDAEELARKENVKVFSDSIIYRLIESYEKWVKEEKSKELYYELQATVFPAKIHVLPGYVFRRKDPAVVGVRVLSGVIRPGYPLMRDDGRPLGKIYQIQHKGKSVSEAKAGAEVAISIVGNVLVGRHFDEGDILYTDPTEADLEKVLTKFRDMVDEEMIELIRELIKVKQKREKRFGLPVIMLLKKMGKRK